MNNSRYEGTRRREFFALQKLSVHLAAAFLRQDSRDDLRLHTTECFLRACYVSVAVATEEGLLSTGDLRREGRVTPALLPYAGSAAGQAWRGRASRFFERRRVGAALADVNAAYSARGAALLCCVPIPGVKVAQQAGYSTYAQQDCQQSGDTGSGSSSEDDLPLGVITLGLQESARLNAFLRARLECDLRVCAECLSALLHAEGAQRSAAQQARQLAAEQRLQDHLRLQQQQQHQQQCQQQEEEQSLRASSLGAVAAAGAASGAAAVPAGASAEAGASTSAAAHRQLSWPPPLPHCVSAPNLQGWVEGMGSPAGTPKGACLRSGPSLLAAAPEQQPKVEGEAGEGAKSVTVARGSGGLLCGVRRARTAAEEPEEAPPLPLGGEGRVPLAAEAPLPLGGEGRVPLAAEAPLPLGKTEMMPFEAEARLPLPLGGAGVATEKTSHAPATQGPQQPPPANPFSAPSGGAALQGPGTGLPGGGGGKALSRQLTKRDSTEVYQERFVKWSIAQAKAEDKLGTGSSNEQATRQEGLTEPFKERLQSTIHLWKTGMSDGSRGPAAEREASRAPEPAAGGVHVPTAAAGPAGDAAGRAAAAELLPEGYQGLLSREACAACLEDEAAAQGAAAAATQGAAGAAALDTPALRSQRLSSIAQRLSSIPLAAMAPPAQPRGGSPGCGAGIPEGQPLARAQRGGSSLQFRRGLHRFFSERDHLTKEASRAEEEAPMPPALSQSLPTTIDRASLRAHLSVQPSGDPLGDRAALCRGSKSSSKNVAQGPDTVFEEGVQQQTGASEEGPSLFKAAATPAEAAPAAGAAPQQKEPPPNPFALAASAPGPFRAHPCSPAAGKTPSDIPSKTPQGPLEGSPSSTPSTGTSDNGRLQTLLESPLVTPELRPLGAPLGARALHSSLGLPRPRRHHSRSCPLLMRRQVEAPWACAIAAK